MQVLFLFFSYFFHSSHILIWGLNLWTILSIMLQPISKKSFILSAQRLSPAFKAQLCILSWSLPFSEHWIISCIFYPGSLQSLHFSARLMNPCGTFETFIFSFFIRKYMGISVSASGCFTVLLLSVSGCASRNVFYCFCFLHIFRDSRPEFPDLRHPAFLFQCNIFIWNVWIYFRQDPFSSRDRTWLCSLTLVDNIIFLLCIYMFSARSSVILFSISTTTINTFPYIYN